MLQVTEMVFVIFLPFWNKALSGRSLFIINQCSSGLSSLVPLLWVSLTGLFFRRGAWQLNGVVVSHGKSPVRRGRKNRTLDVNLYTKFDIWMIKTSVLCSGPYNWWWIFLGRNWHEVKHVGVAELQLVCLHAREREQDSLQVMVPVPVHISLSHERWGCGQCLARVTNKIEWRTDIFNRLLMPWSRGEGGGDKAVSEESNISACEQSYFGCCKCTCKVESPLIF